MDQRDEQVPDMAARPEKGDYAGQKQVAGQYGDADQEQSRQQPGAPGASADTGQASYGNSGEGQPPLQPSPRATDLSAGQTSASQAGLTQEQTMDQEPLAADHSTDAQRSGGQREGGAGSDDRSFEGSSFGK